MDKHFLTPLFAPRSIVVIDDGGTRHHNADALEQALHASAFKGELQHVDLDSSSHLAELVQSRPDLALIALQPSRLVGALELASRLGCRAALLLGSGVDAQLAQQLRDIAQRDGMLLLGPNSLGYQRPLLQLNASAAAPLAASGSLALVSQSGALTTSMLDWASKNGVGFSSVVAIGPHSGIDVADALDWLANDGQTHSILVYLEGIQDARRFMSMLRSAANAKPVVVLKAGRRAAGSSAALTHSGAIVGADDVFDAALRRAGAVRVRSFVELFSAAKCLASRFRPVGRRLAIVTNGGGPGVLASDWIDEIGLQAARLSQDTAQRLLPQLPPLANVDALIDLSEEAGPEHYRAALDAAAHDPGVDGVLAIYSPKLGSDPGACAAVLADLGGKLGKPLLSCWMGDASMEGARELLRSADVPSFRTPEAAVGAFGNIATFYQNQQLMLQTPSPLSTLPAPDVECARLLIESVLAERRRVLTEMESKALLSAFHIPVTNTALARNANEAMILASQLGYPVALKIDSPDISHKSDVQGVMLNLGSGSSVREGFEEMLRNVKRHLPQARVNGVTVQKMAPSQRGREVCIGVANEAPFGPVISFGAGGTMIELIDDRAIELPPLNQFLAHRLIERARVAETLGEWRGANAVKLEAIEQLLLRVSEMVCELPQLREMDINPVIVDEHGAIAVDARIVVEPAPPVVAGRAVHYNHLAILPYPASAEQIWPLPGGGEYLMRAVRPDDGAMLQELVQGLSPESRYMRYVSTRSELPPAMLARFTLIDYDREMALVAVLPQTSADGTTVDGERIIGVSRYVINPDHRSCEFALVVADDFNGKGIGSRLMLRLMDVARERGLEEIQGLVLSNNPGMLKLMRSLDFEVMPFAEDPDFKLVTHKL